MRDFYESFYPSMYSIELFDAYYDTLVDAYCKLDNVNNPTDIATLKTLLVLLITFPRTAIDESYTCKFKYDKLESDIRGIKTENEFRKVCLDVFEALHQINLYIDLYKQTFITQEITNTKIVKIMKDIANNIVNGNETNSQRLLFMFYLSFRHELIKMKKPLIDEAFFQKNSLYDMNKLVMSKGDEASLFIKREMNISGSIT